MSDTCVEIILRFERLSIRTSEVQPMSLEAFEQLGTRYLDAFVAERSEDRDWLAGTRWHKHVRARIEAV